MRPGSQGCHPSTVVVNIPAPSPRNLGARGNHVNPAWSGSARLERDRDLAECPCPTSSDGPWKTSCMQYRWGRRGRHGARSSTSGRCHGVKRYATTNNNNNDDDDDDDSSLVRVCVSRGPSGLSFDPAWSPRRIGCFCTRTKRPPLPPCSVCLACTKPQSLIDNSKRMGRLVYETRLSAPLHHDPCSWLTLISIFPIGFLFISPSEPGTGHAAHHWAQFGPVQCQFSSPTVCVPALCSAVCE